MQDTPAAAEILKARAFCVPLPCQKKSSDWCFSLPSVFLLRAAHSMKRGFTITAALVVATLALLMGMVMFAGAIDSVRTGMLEGFSLTRVVKSAIQGLGLHCVLIGNKWLLRSVGLYQVFQTFSFVVGGLLASVFYSYGDFRLREDRFGLITAVLLSAVIPVPPTAMGSFGGP